MTMWAICQVSQPKIQLKLRAYTARQNGFEQKPEQMIIKTSKRPTNGLN